MTSRKQRPIVPTITEESNRKEFKWRQLPEGLYCVFFEGGGEVPQELTGTWTSVNKMLSAIENYKAKRGY